MKKIDVVYDILKDKLESQIFYNHMMLRLVNPLARDIFRSLRDDDERDVVNLQKQVIALEAKPMIFKAFITGKGNPRE